MTEPMNETEDAATIKYAPSVLNSLLADMERMAWVTKNPLFIWNGISLCVEQNLPVPEYALDYIKAVATALAPFTRETILKDKKNKVKLEEISKRVLDALQITTGAGCPNAFENMRRDLAGEVALANEPLRKVMRPPRYRSPELKAAADKTRNRKLAKAKALRGRTKPPPKPSA
jgi:hypothetical protein